MSWDAYQLLAVTNLVICLGIAWCCICRLNTHICRLHWQARTRYTLLLTGALAHGAQPLLFYTTPGPSGVLFAAAVLANLLLGVDNWRAALHNKTSCQ